MLIDSNTENFKFCPSCGSNSLKTNDCKSFLCSKCGFLFYINTAAATAGLIFDEQKKLLVTVRKTNPGKGSYDLPGGFANPCEKIEETLAREIKEELNLDIFDIEYFDSEPNDYLYRGIHYTTLDIIFRCKVKSFTNIEANDDVEDFLFLNIDELNENDFGLKSIKNVIKKLKIKLQTNN